MNCCAHLTVYPHVHSREAVDSTGVQHINSEFHDQEREPLEPRRINSSHFFLSKSKSISLCEFLVMATKRPFGDNRGDYIPLALLHANEETAFGDEHNPAQSA